MSVLPSARDQPVQARITFDGKTAANPRCNPELGKRAEGFAGSWNPVTFGTHDADAQVDMQNGRSFCHATRDGGRRARAVGASLALIAAACFLVTNHAAADAQRDSGSSHPPSGPATRITTITEDGGRLDWSARLNLIAFDRMGRDGYFDVYAMTPDGKQVTCVTCDKPELPNKQIGNPAWHPSGDFIVFQAQNTFKGLGRLTDYFANPGAGINNDVWIGDREGRHFWQLTAVKPRVGGVLHPHFSDAGDKLLWAERVANGGGKWGTWALRIADFAVDGGVPRIRNERTVQPGSQRKMYESHGFSPDGRQILFSGNLEPGQEETRGDVYLYDLATGALKNLTQSPDEWDEHAHFSPDGNTIVWMTSKGQVGKLREAQPSTDFWLMDRDGSHQRRLTYFNQPGSPEFINRNVTAADNAWSPDGRRIAAYVITDVRKGGRIVMIDLLRP